MESVNILGVRVDKVIMEQSVDLVEGWLKGNGKHYIVTPNPEFIMAAQQDSDFKKILNDADLAVPDSTRLGWASKMLSEKEFLKKVLLWPFFLFPTKQLIPFDTVAGVDLIENLVERAAKRGFTVGFFGGQNGVAKEAADCSLKKYPKLKIVLAEDGPNVDEDGEEVFSIKYLVSSEKQKPPNAKYQIPNTDILFVAFGQVKQEKWIAKNLDKITVKVAMGVGGSFDYLSGRVPRAPKFMRKLGLEWLFRLILQPWRIKRQIVLLNFAWKVMIK